VELSVICPSCGTANESLDRYCGECGKPLTAAGEKTPQPSAPEGELRPVTVLFADLSGFTALSGRLDPEEARDLLNDIFAITDAAVVAAGGTVDKHIGDGLMAVFGAPVAHDDDPARAVQAAFAMRSQLQAHAEQEGRHGLSMHAGIASGLVAAASTGSSLHSAYTMTGQAVNLAARLCDLAAAGEIHVTGDVAEAASVGFLFEPLGPQAVAGFDEPVPVWTLVDQSTDANDLRSMPFVGREREVRQILAVVESCLESASGQVVHLRGDAGIGKSRLAEEAVQLAHARGFRVLKAANLAFGSGQENQTLRVMFARLLGITGEADPETWRAGLASALDAGRIPPELEGVACDLAGLPLPERARTSFNALDAQGRSAGRARLLSRLFAEAGKDGPILCLVEDLHWSEPEMTASLAAAAAATSRKPVLFLLTSRREGDPVNEAWRLQAGDTPVAAFDLAPLSSGHAESLARNVMTVTGGEIAGIVERANGNPLFLIQLLHHLRNARDGTLPTSIHSLITARLDRLADRDRAAIQAASVLGARFGRQELAHLLAENGYDPGPLVAAHLVRPAEGAFEFAHALIRDAVYESLTKTRRRSLHGRAAGMFEDRDRLLFAQHLDRSGDERAARAYHAAAAASFGGLKHAEAGQQNARGLELASLPDDRWNLMAQRAEILFEQGEIAACIALWRDVLDMDAPGPADTVRALIGLAQGCRVTEDATSALEALAKAEELAVAQGLTRERSRIHFLRGNLLFPQGRMDACLKEHSTALELAQSAGSPEAEAQALGGLGDAYYGLGRMRSAYDTFSRCVALAHEHGFGRIVLANMPMAGITSLFSGLVEDAIRLERETVAMAKQAGIIRAEMIGHHLAFWIHMDKGEVDGAFERIERAQEIALALGASRFQAQNLAHLAQLHCLSGDAERALDLAREAWRMCEETGPAYIGPVALAEIACATRDDAEQRAAIAKAEALLAAGAVSHNHFLYYRRMIEYAVERREREEVERWAASLEDYMRAEPMQWCAYVCEWGRALAGWNSNGTAEGQRHIEELVERGRRMGFGRLAGIAEAKLAKVPLPG